MWTMEQYRENMRKLSIEDFMKAEKEENRKDWREGKKIKIMMLVDISQYGLCEEDELLVVGRKTKHGGIYIMENGKSFNKRFAKRV